MSMSRDTKTLGVSGRTTGEEVRVLIGTNIAGDIVIPTNVDTVTTDKIVGTVGTRTGGASKTLEIAGASTSKLLDDTGALLDGWKDNVNKADVVTIEGLSEYPNGLTADVLSTTGSGNTSKITLVNLSNQFGQPIEPVAFAAQSCTISIERFVLSSAFTSEVSSGLNITQNTSTIVEKRPLQQVNNNPTLGGAATLEKTFDTTLQWQAQATINMTFKDDADLARRLINISLHQRNTPVSMRLVTGPNFSGYYGLARPLFGGGAPAPATPTDIAQIELTFEGQNYLRLMPPIV